MIDQPKEYSVAKGEGGDLYSALAELERNVRRMLDKGWQLQGSISTGGSAEGAFVGKGYVWATQAMSR